MNCKNCSHTYNISARKPITMMPCGHTFCLSCLTDLKSQIVYLCPACKELIISEKPNFELFEFLQQTSSFDPNSRLKQAIQQQAVQLTQLKDKLDLDYMKKCKQNKEIVDSLKNQVNTRTNEFIDSVFTSQRKILLEIDHIQTRLNKSMSEVIFNANNTLDYEQKLEDLEQLSAIELDSLGNQLKNVQIDLNSKTILLSQINSNSCQFVANKSFCLAGQSDNLIGAIHFNRTDLVMSGSFDHSIKIWNITTGDCVKRKAFRLVV